jgi:type II secretory pathway component PulJ
MNPNDLIVIIIGLLATTAVFALMATAFLHSILQELRRIRKNQEQIHALEP